MAARKKKEELSDQLAVYREREAPRFDTQASILIDGYEGEGQLANISIRGGCMQSVTYVAITPNKEYKVTVTPAADEKMPPFSFNLLLNWTKSSEELFQAGFSLKDGQENSQAKRYVEVLRSRGAKPSYGNYSGKRE